MIKKNLFGAVLMVLVLSGTSYAQDSTDQNGAPPDQSTGTEQHSHRAPSQVAIDACSGKSVGDTCDYTNAKGEDKSGTCTNTSDQQTIFCKGSKSSGENQSSS